MSPRKVDPVAAGDVPPPLVGALILYLVAVFVPIVAVTPDLPSTLPPLTYSPNDIFRYHREVRPTPALSFLDEQFSRVTHAAVRRDATDMAAAQRQFAAFLVDARATTAEARAQVRERYLRQILDAVDHGRTDGLVTIAQRHQLAGMYAAPTIDRATLMAWFDFRWEAFAAPEHLRGERVAFANLLARIPAEERRAVVAWVLDGTCASLLGLRPNAGQSARETEQCASARREFVDAAGVIDPTYPVAEARAAIDVMLGHDLDAIARTTVDETTRDGLRTAARESFQRAHGAYTLLAAHDGSRRIRRYLRGALEATASN